MRAAFTLCCAVGSLFAGSAVDRVADSKLTPAIRNQACVELRGDRSDETVRAMRVALADSAVRACAARNLVMAAAGEALLDALADPDPQVRAVAARELGGFEKRELLPVLARAARDADLLVASNAVEGLKKYRPGMAEPFLRELAMGGGVVGSLALGRLLDLRAPEALSVAREKLRGGEAADKLMAIQTLGEMGDRSDLKVLAPIAERDREMMSSSGRGFGLMPSFSLSKASHTAMARIEARRGSESGQ